MTSVFMEIDLAKELCEKKLDKINSKELILIGAYLRQYKEYGQKKIFDFLVGKCQEVDKYFNPIISRNFLDRCVRISLKKKPLQNVDKVYIYEDELSEIKKIRNFKKQCLLISLLAISKFRNKHNKRFFFDYKNDLRLALKISGSGVTKKTFETELLHEFYSNGLTLCSDSYDTMELFYGKKEGKELFEISSSDIIKEKYKVFLGGEIKYCRVCNLEIISNSNKTEYCKEHSYQKELERKRNWKKNALVAK